MKRTDLAFYGFRGGAGGISRVVLNLINQCAACGLAVDVVLHRTDIPEVGWIHPSVHRVELGERGELKKVQNFADYLEQRSPQAVMCMREPANRVLILARMKAGVETKVVFRVGMPMSIALARRAWPKRALRKASIRFCYKRADIIIANQRRVAADIVDVTGIAANKVHVIANPTVSPLLFEQAQEPPEHDWLRNKQKPVVMGIGRLARQKDFATLIRAFREVRGHLDARLIIIGEGKERSKLEKLCRDLDVADSVDFPGFYRNPFSALARADLFVLSSAWEGLPNVLIEALALGIPVVATDCKSGPREILDYGKYGPLVPVGDYQEMAKAMLDVLHAPPDKLFLQNGSQRYDVETCTEKYLQVIGLK